MPASNLPKDWEDLAAAAGIRPSMNGIAQAANIDPSTFGRNMRGVTTPSHETVEALARTLRTDPERIAELFGIRIGEAGWWSPPIEAHQMTTEQREAVNALVIILGRTQADAPQKTQPATRVAGISRRRKNSVPADAQYVEQAAYRPAPRTQE